MKFIDYAIVFCLLILSFACSNRTKVVDEVTQNVSSIPTEKMDYVDDELLSSGEDVDHPRKAINPYFFSDLRPQEKLYTNIKYIDTVELLEYNDDSDYWFIKVRKDTSEVVLLNGVDQELSLHSRHQQGDFIQIEWEMDSMWVAGDGESLWIEEWARKTSKIN